MDRQIPAERAWGIPHQLQLRLGSLEIEDIVRRRRSTIIKAMSQPASLHRYNEVMGSNIYDMAVLISEKYHGKASNIWNDNPSSAGLISRFLEFKGIGQKISTMAANILVRDFKIKVKDKYSIDISVDVHIKRMFHRLGFAPENITNDYIVYKAREINPTYPGIFDLALWDIAREQCSPRNPKCSECKLESLCPTHNGN